MGMSNKSFGSHTMGIECEQQGQVLEMQFLLSILA